MPYLIAAGVGGVATYFVSDTVQKTTKWLLVGGVVLGGVVYGPKILKAMRS